MNVAVMLDDPAPATLIVFPLIELTEEPLSRTYAKVPVAALGVTAGFVTAI